MTDKTCFIAMPLTTTEEAANKYGDREHFMHVLEHLFVPAVEAAGYKAIKPIMTGADMIQAKIISYLETADLVLCDVSDQNPNVFFELGIRTALDRPVALVSDKLSGRLPFDTNMINTHFYDASIATWVLEEERSRLTRHVIATGESAAGKNSLWNYFGLTKRATESMPSENPLEAKVDLLLRQISNNGISSLFQPRPVIPIGSGDKEADEYLTIVTRLYDLGERFDVQMDVGQVNEQWRVKTADDPSHRFVNALFQVAEEFELSLVLMDSNRKVTRRIR